jgi:hypothetical protein
MRPSDLRSVFFDTEYLANRTTQKTDTRRVHLEARNSPPARRASVAGISDPGRREYGRTQSTPPATASRWLIARRSSISGRYGRLAREDNVASWQNSEIRQHSVCAARSRCRMLNAIWLSQPVRPIPPGTESISAMM